MAALAEVFACERCGKLIPCANRQLHELRCGGVPDTPAVDAAAVSDGDDWDKLSDLSTPSNPATVTTVEGGWAVVSEEGTNSVPRDPDNHSVANLSDLGDMADFLGHSDVSDIDGDTISLASGENTDGEPQVVPPPRRRPPANMARAARMMRPRPRIYTPTEEERAADAAVERRMSVAGKRVQRRRENQKLAGVPEHIVAGCGHADPVPGISLTYHSHFERLFEENNADIMARFAGGYNTLHSRKEKKRSLKDAQRRASASPEPQLRLCANPYATLSEDED
mmetsp:Transcript_18117/g.37984  ORF Transcript_18117/g.37984 Transcript_18117/m.37984 type:complete len:281 (-) Transcript_18117:82-924(-)